MNSLEIINNINEITTVSSNYVVFPTDDDNVLYGKDNEGNAVFIMRSHDIKQLSLCQETKSLIFFFNKKCILEEAGVSKEEIAHILVCKTPSTDKLAAFIRLTYAFAEQVDKDDQLYLPKLFSSLSGLFDKERTVSEIELQGLFAELYVILYFEENKCPIASNWQSRSKMKFDFSISEKKRLEIKSTLKQERVHHFRHEQLLSEMYDIKIASLMLQKNDCGISIKEVIDRIRDIYSKDYALLMRIELITSQVQETQLNSLKYDEEYLKQHIAFFDAKDAPHFNEKSPEGVFNVEYDCSFENIEKMDFISVAEWVKEEKGKQDN